MKFNDEQIAFRDSVRRIVDRSVAPIAAEIDETDRFPLELVKLFGEMGLMQLWVPERYGGPEGDLTMMCIAREEISRVSPACGSIAGLNTMFIMPLLHFGSEEQRGDEATLSPPHERALAHARGWRGRDGAWPFAAHAAQADGIAVGDAAWGLATPVHWHVGRDHVVLSDPDALNLGEAESRALFDAARGLFESEGLRIEWGAPTRWYLAHDSLDDLACASPDRVIARPIEPWLRPEPGSEARSRLVRRLQSELQMLLYPHPVNETREQRGELPVNSFWLSGCGRFQPSREDAPRVLDALRAPLLADDWPGWIQAWRALDGTELAHLLEAAQSGAPVSFTLCGERSAQRFESAPRSMWRRLAARWRTVEPRTVLETL